MIWLKNFKKFISPFPLPAKTQQNPQQNIITKTDLKNIETIVDNKYHIDCTAMVESFVL